MGRILFFVILALAIWWFIKSWQRKLSGDDSKPENLDQTKEKAVKNTKESIHPCKHCGAYSPLTSGIMVQGRFYCNSEHANAEGERV